MKHAFTKVFFLAALFLHQTLPVLAVTFTDTPSAVSNTYTGQITLQIGGVTSGDTVVVQKFLDLNTNGLVEAGDYLIQQFSLTDGQAPPVIGGVANFNVPGDLNATAGAISAQMNFNNGDFVQNIVGKYLFVLSSPAGHFSPITNSFSVTNFPFAQSISGNVVSNSTSTTLSNAIVLLFPPPKPNGGLGHPVAATVANSAGAYTIAVPPGNYLMFAVKSNFVANVSAPAVVTLGASSLTTNLSLLKAGANISGKLVDANNSATVLPGVFAPVSDNGLIAICFTDTNGNFNAPVSAGSWDVGSDSDGLILHGYVGYENSPTNVSSGTTGLYIGFKKATSLFYGSVKDTLGNPFSGIAIQAYDNNNNLYQQDGYTDANGNFVVGAVGGLGSGDPWDVNFDFGGPTNYVFTQSAIDQNGGTNISSGQAVLINFVGLLATNFITGNVRDSSGNPISGVQVDAYANIGLYSYQTEMDTDANGNYSLNVANGAWSVSVLYCCDNDSLNNLGSYQQPNSHTVNIANNNGLANFTVQADINDGGTLQVTTSSPLPNGTNGFAYDQQLNADGGSPPQTGNYSWSQISGSLPSGLNLDSGGFIYGTPTATGISSFTLQVSDQNGSTVNQSFSLTIKSGVLQVTTTSLPFGITNVAYSQQLTASGGQPFGSGFYTWTNLAGKLPPGLILATNGIISGTPTVLGTSNLTMRVTDSLSATATQALSLAISPVTTSINFSVSPSAISNGYGGTLSLQVTGAGLFTNETVVVQQFADLNTNGVIDAGDLLLQQFNLTDGQASVFADGSTTVTNLNVPGDFNVTPGAITALLYPQTSFGGQTIVGQYFYKLSSPAGHFSPITNSFSVTNFPYAQSFTGTVVSNGTSTTLPNTIVLLSTFSTDGSLTVIGGTVANSAGNYTLKAPAGTNYVLFGVRSNYVANTAVPPLTLTNGTTFTTNISLLAATQSISGRFNDLNNASLGLPAISGAVQSSNNLVAVYFGDTSGNFNVKVTGSQWKVESSDSSLALHGYVRLQNSIKVLTTTGSVSGVTVALPQATALFYGSVKDNLGNPVPGVNLYPSDDSGQYESSATTDVNGNYFAGVLAGDTWQEYIDSDQSAVNSGYVFSQPQLDQNGGATLSLGQAMQVNFTAIASPNVISGFVRDNNGKPIVDVQVYGNATINSLSYQSAGNTDTNGNYSFVVANGTWSVQVYNGGNDNSLSSNYQEPNSQTVNIANNNGLANFTVQTNINSGGTLQVTTSSPLPNGTNGLAYDQQLNADGGSPPQTGNYSWSQISGSLPSGLNLDSGGFIYGTPTATGISSFTLQVSDQNGSTANKAFSLTISASGVPLQITTTSLTNGTTSAVYSQQLTASGGQPFGSGFYTWTNLSGKLPPGLTLATNGIISGTPTVVGTSNLTMRVTDFLSATATQALSLVINPKPVLGLSSWLTNRFSMLLTGASNQNYTLQMSTNLAAANWNTLFVTNKLTTNAFLITDPNATNKQRFYRILIGP